MSLDHGCLFWPASVVRSCRRIGAKANDVATTCVSESVVDLTNGPLTVGVAVNAVLGRHQSEESRVGWRGGRWGTKTVSCYVPQNEVTRSLDVSTTHWSIDLGGSLCRIFLSVNDSSDLFNLWGHVVVLVFWCWRFENILIHICIHECVCIYGESQRVYTLRLHFSCKYKQ